MKKIVSVACVLCLLTACKSSQKVNNEVVKEFQLERFLGTWYEIARFDHRFEKEMHHTMAFYSLDADGRLKVVNTGIRDGKEKVAEGKGKTTDTPAHLRVSFFGPFYADYRVLLLDEEYSYALIGSKSSRYLWILARAPQLTETALEHLLDEAQRRGYNVDELIWVEH